MYDSTGQPYVKRSFICLLNYLLSLHNKDFIAKAAIYCVKQCRLSAFSDMLELSEAFKAWKVLKRQIVEFEASESIENL